MDARSGSTAAAETARAANGHQGRQVLIVEDDPSVREFLQTVFHAHGYDCHVAKNGREGLELFRAHRPPLAVTDLRMSVMGGRELLKAAHALDPHAAIIMITGSHDVELAIECMKGGAADFIVKPFDIKELLMAAERALERRQLLLDRDRYQEELERRVEEATRELAYAARYDALTGLANRALFRDRLTGAQARARREGHKIALLFLDLDRFKVINDTFGHDAGDRLLIAVTERFRHCVREPDSIARLGGDEFTVILEALDEETDAAVVAERILKAIAAPLSLGGREIVVTASIGIAMSAAGAEDATTLLKHADTAMYRAKEQGGNTYQFHSPDMNAKVLARLALESDLRRAVERDEFLLHYQPRVELGTGRMVGAEALLRWRHPTQGLVLPGSFVSVAEESGLIVPIGERVLQHACAQGHAWQAAGLDPMRIAVNLSARQFRQPSLQDVIGRTLRESGFAPEHLELEITESLLMDPTSAIRQTLHDLRDLGLQIAIDDFGTGYSSLNYLKRFPINTLKIDQSFIRDITVDPDAAAIVRAIIALAKSLRLTVVAEGVETEAQLSALQGYGCDEVQGHLVSRPLPAEGFAAFRARSGSRG